MYSCRPEVLLSGGLVESSAGPPTDHLMHFSLFPFSFLKISSHIPHWQGLVLTTSTVCNIKAFWHIS